MSIFEELRVLDDQDEPLALRFASTGLPMWPFVRWQAVSAAQEQALGHQVPFATTPRRTLGERAALAARAALRGPLTVSRPFEIVIVSSSGGLVVQREGRWFDRINDYFAMEMPEQTLVLDAAGAAGYKTPRFPPHVRCHETFALIAGLAARVTRPRDADLVSIERVVDFVRDRFPVRLQASALDRIRAELVHWAVRLPVLRALYARFFDRVRPRLLFIEDASYGAFAHVCTWARQAGIVTAELQHGVISRSHLAYNVGDAARRDDAFARCLPEHLLLYGELWARQVCTPSQLAVIGCPHFSERAPAAAADSQTVLTISQGICTDAMVRLTAALARRFPARRFVFRLHRGELAFPERYRELTTIENIEISDGGDLFRELGRVGVVIGHSSTAVVEAAGVGLPVLVLDDDTSRAMLPEGVGTWFRTADELAALVDTPAPRARSAEQFFASGWRERYRSFVTRVSVAS